MHALGQWVAAYAKCRLAKLLGKRLGCDVVNRHALLTAASIFC